jgi:hypothetical protein
MSLNMSRELLASLQEKSHQVRCLGLRDVSQAIVLT